MSRRNYNAPSNRQRRKTATVRFLEPRSLYLVDRFSQGSITAKQRRYLEHLMENTPPLIRDGFERELNSLLTQSRASVLIKLLERYVAQTDTTIDTKGE